MSITIKINNEDKTNEIIDFTYNIDQDSLDINAEFLSMTSYSVEDTVEVFEDGVSVFKSDIRDIKSEILIGKKRIYTYHLQTPAEALKTQRWSANSVNGNYDYDLVSSLLSSDGIDHSVIGTITKTAVANDGWKDIPAWQMILSLALMSGWAVNWKAGTLYFQNCNYESSSVQSLDESDIMELKVEKNKDVLNKVHLISRQDFYSITMEHSGSIGNYGENEMNTQTMAGNQYNLGNAGNRIINANKEPVYTLTFDTTERLDATQLVSITFTGDLADLSGVYAVQKEEHIYTAGSVHHNYTVKGLVENTVDDGQGGTTTEYNNTQLIQKSDILNKALGTNAFSNTPSDSALPDVEGAEGNESGAEGGWETIYSTESPPAKNTLDQAVNHNSIIVAYDEGYDYSIISTLGMKTDLNVDTEAGKFRVGLFETSVEQKHPTGYGGDYPAGRLITYEKKIVHDRYNTKKEIVSTYLDDSGNEIGRAKISTEAKMEGDDIRKARMEAMSLSTYYGEASVEAETEGQYHTVKIHTECQDDKKADIEVHSDLNDGFIRACTDEFSILIEKSSATLGAVDGTKIEISKGGNITITDIDGNQSKILPDNGLTQNVVVGDGSGGTKTLHFKYGLLMSVS